MSKGETARLEIEPEWAYGKKGLPDSKYLFVEVINNWADGSERNMMLEKVSKGPVRVLGGLKND